MFERYIEPARRVIFFARYESCLLASPDIRPEHILLGIVREDPAVMLGLLDEKFPLGTIREKVEASTKLRGTYKKHTHLPLSNSSKRVLAYAAQWADQIGSQPITPQHLLYGLLREENTLATQILTNHGITLKEVEALPQLSPSEQQKWRNVVLKRAVTKRKSDITYGFVLGLFLVLLFQIVCKTAGPRLTHEEAIFYSIAFPVVSTAVAVAGIWRYRQGSIPHRKARRNLLWFTFAFIIAMAMALTALS